MNSEQHSSAYQASRSTLGSTAFVAGLDKFFNLLTDWKQYLSPPLKGRLAPHSPSLARRRSFTRT